MSSFTRLPHSLPTKVLRTLTAHSGSVRCLPTRALSTTSPAGSAPAPAQLAPLVPPFTLDTATRKVKMAQDAWNSRDPQRVSLVYTPDSVWRNRDQFFAGREAIVEFLTDKWAKEKGYRLRKQLHSFGGNKIAVNFWYESFSDELGTWRRTYGLEHVSPRGEGVADGASDGLPG